MTPERIADAWREVRYFPETGDPVEMLRLLLREALREIQVLQAAQQARSILQEELT